MGSAETPEKMHASGGTDAGERSPPESDMTVPTHIANLVEPSSVGVEAVLTSADSATPSIVGETQRDAKVDRGQCVNALVHRDCAVMYAATDVGRLRNSIVTLIAFPHIVLISQIILRSLQENSTQRHPRRRGKEAKHAYFQRARVSPTRRGDA